LRQTSSQPRPQTLGDGRAVQPWRHFHLRIAAQSKVSVWDNKLLQNTKRRNFAMTIISSRESGILIAISGRRIHWRRLTVCTCAAVWRIDTRAIHLAEQNDTQSCDRKRWYGIIKPRNWTITQFYRHLFLGTQVTLHSGPSPAAATWRHRIVDVLIPEKIKKSTRLSASLCAPYFKYCVHNSPQLNLILSPMKINPHPHIWGTISFRANRRLKVASGFSFQGFF